MESTGVAEVSPLRKPFFIAYIVTGVISLALHVRFIMIVQCTRSLAKLPAYRVIQSVSAASIINIISQIVAIACTFADNDINHTLNWIDGAIFQGSWAVEYPMNFILAANRLISVAFPHLLDRLCNRKMTTVSICMCWGFGAFNTTICMSGEVQTIWIASIPTFVFTDGTFLASFLSAMDFYFAEFIVCASIACYIAMLLVLSIKNELKTLKVELPLLLHIGTTFTFTTILLYLWHNPASSSEIYCHFFNLFVVFRSCLSPVLAILTNKKVRKQFFPQKLDEISVEPRFQNR